MIRVAIIELGYSQTELSEVLGLHYSSISRLLKTEMSKWKTWPHSFIFFSLNNTQGKAKTFPELLISDWEINT